MRSDGLLLREISSSLGITQTSGFEKNDPFYIKTTDSIHPEPWGVWRYDSDVFLDSLKVGDHIKFIIDTFLEKAPALQRYLDDTTYDLRFWVVDLMQSKIAEFGLHKNIMQDLMKLCNSIVIDLSVPYLWDRKDLRDLHEEGSDIQGAVLGIRGSDFQLAEVTEKLGITPTFSYRKGDVYPSVSGEQKTHQYTYWQYDSYPFVKSYRMEDHIDHILSIFEGKKEALEPFLKNPSYDVVLRIWIGDFIRTLEIYTPILERLNRICNAYYFTLCNTGIYHDETEDMKFIE